MLAFLEEYDLIVDDRGRIYSSDGWIRRTNPGYYGYITITYKDKHGKPKSIQAHRLVAIAFIPNPENKPCVNHIDGNRANNHVSNLEWVTYRENNIDMHRRLGRLKQVL